MKVKIKESVFVSGETCKAGDVVDLPEADAEQLIRLRRAEPHTQRKRHSRPKKED